jgi:hypothetical protein
MPEFVVMDNCPLLVTSSVPNIGGVLIKRDSTEAVMVVVTIAA